jgi:hypothetical protein
MTMAVTIGEVDEEIAGLEEEIQVIYKIADQAALLHRQYRP